MLPVGPSYIDMIFLKLLFKLYFIKFYQKYIRRIATCVEYKNCLQSLPFEKISISNFPYFSNTRDFTLLTGYFSFHL